MLPKQGNFSLSRITLIISLLKMWLNWKVHIHVPFENKYFRVEHSKILKIFGLCMQFDSRKILPFLVVLIIFMHKLVTCQWV